MMTELANRLLENQMRPQASPSATGYASVVTDLCIIEQKIMCLRQCLRAFDDEIAADIESDLQTAESYVNFARHKGERHNDQADRPERRTT